MITLQNISKRYPMRNGYHPVLSGVNATIHPGERFGILGRNGAGKSTLIRIISGQEDPDSGIIERDMKVSWPIAFSGAFQGSLTGYDNIKFIARIHGIDPASIKDMVEDFSELGSFLREPVKVYSSGMRARLAFSLSLAIEFDCYLIDEVLSVGDARFQEKCVYELFERRKDRAYILVSHSQSFIKRYCQRVAVLEKGMLYHFDDVSSAFGYYLNDILQLKSGN
jgi:capsular polysaccharide transport system ATP-binding protein